MIDIRIPSRFGDDKTFLQASLSSDADGFTVDEISSPLSGVTQNYIDEIHNQFNYSFIDELGFHETIGYEKEPLRNLLILLAREKVLNYRKIIFAFDDKTASDFVNNQDFLSQLISQPEKTISQIESIFSDDTIASIGLWIFYFHHTLLLDRSETDYSELVDIYLSSDVISKTLFSIDSRFFFNHSKKGSYIALRNMDIPNLRVLSFFSTRYASNDSHWRVKDAINIAARQVNKGSLNQAIFRQLLNTMRGNYSPIPSFLPQVKTPVSTALQVLKHFDFNLPDLEKVCTVLGVSLCRININNNILGLFLNNIEAHQPIIFINTSIRNEGSQNFTIAHEIGHYLLHFESYIVTCDEKDIYFPTQSDTKEVEANIFASELLMPTPLFRDFCKEPFNTQNIETISNHFVVSKEAAARRRIDLDKKRKLAFVVVKDQRITSMIASVINDDGVRWIGRPTVKKRAVSKIEAISLNDKNEVYLHQYLLDIDEDNTLLHDLDIDVYPFLNSNGYYLFIEKS